MSLKAVERINLDLKAARDKAFQEMLKLPAEYRGLVLFEGGWFYRHPVYYGLIMFAIGFIFKIIV